MEVQDLGHEIGRRFAAPAGDRAADPGCLVGSLVGRKIIVGALHPPADEPVAGDAEREADEEQPPTPRLTHRPEYRRAARSTPLHRGAAGVRVGMLRG